MILRLEKAGLIEVTREGNKPNIYQLTTNEKLLREFSKLFSKGNKHD
jgi:DNA-binding PadR family transcriptional regulator